MKSLVYIILAAAGVFLSAAPLRAQDPQFGDFTFSYGYQSFLRPRHEHEGTNSQRVKGSLKLALDDKFSVKVSNTTLNSRQRADGTRVNGIGATALSFRGDFVKEDPTGVARHPAFSAEYVITLPTASKALGNFRGTDHYITTAFVKSVGANEVINGNLKWRSEVEVDLGASFGQKEAGGYSRTPEMTLAFSHALDDLSNKKYVYRGEIYMAAATRDKASEVFALNQLSIKLQPKARFSAGVRTGLTANSPRLVFSGSVSFSGSFR